MERHTRRRDGLLRCARPGYGTALATTVNRTAQEQDPTKRKRPWGAGVFIVNLGVVGVLIIHATALGGCKGPREFREFLLLYRTTELPELVITTGLPAFITGTLAVWVRPLSEVARAVMPNPATSIPTTNATTT